MLADEQTRQQQALLAAQMGMARPQVQQAPQYIPAPQAPSINFNPTIITGGQSGQVGQPGAGGAGAPGAGGMIGGGGVVSPGVIGGAGGGPQWNGGAGGGAGAPQGPPPKYEQVLSGLKGRFSNIPATELEMYARSIVAAPSARASILETLKQKSSKRTATDKDNVKADANGNIIGPDGRHYRLDGKQKIFVDPVTGKDLPTTRPSTKTSSAAPLNVPANYRGWTKNGNPYTGPEYNGYALSRADYTRLSRAGQSLAPYKLRWINLTPKPIEPRDPFVDVPVR